MKTAFAISEEDIKNVLHSNTLNVSYTQGQSIALLASEILPTLDLQRIEEAALWGDDLGEQTDHAHDEITRQLIEAGILED